MLIHLVAATGVLGLPTVVLGDRRSLHRPAALTRPTGPGRGLGRVMGVVLIGLGLLVSSLASSGSADLGS